MPTNTRKSNTTSAKKETSAVQTQAQEDIVTVSRDEFERMKAQMEAMMQMMAMNQAVSTSQASKKKERNISFVNMTKGRYVIKGTSYYVIENQFGYRSFTEREARVIVNNMEKDILDGRLYIADAEFVRDCDLEGVYQTLLSDKDMLDLLKHDSRHVIEIYKNANNGQKKIIEEMIEEKRLNGQEVDGNVLIEISKLSGKDLLNVVSVDSEE